MKTPKVPFVNAIKMHEENPNTFEIPTQEDLKKLKVGTSCKICALRERFWVNVTEIKDDGTIIGYIDNDLLFSDEHGLYADDVVSFRVENIYDLENF